MLIQIHASSNKTNHLEHLNEMAAEYWIRRETADAITGWASAALGRRSAHGREGNGPRPDGWRVTWTPMRQFLNRD